MQCNYTNLIQSTITICMPFCFFLLSQISCLRFFWPGIPCRDLLLGPCSRGHPFGGAIDKGRSHRWDLRQQRLRNGSSVCQRWKASPLFWYLMSWWFIMIHDDLCPRRLLGQVCISKGQVFETWCQFCWEENGDRISWGAIKYKNMATDFLFWVEKPEFQWSGCFWFP